MANSAGYHEAEEKLRPETQDNHRALTSMQEELEAAVALAHKDTKASRKG